MSVEIWRAACAVLTCAFTLLSLSGAVLADRSAQFGQLMQAIRLDDTVQTMREEGLLYGSNLITDMMEGGDTPGWRLRVGQIYNTEKMAAVLSERLDNELSEADLEPLVTFFASDLGGEIVSLELASREAFFDEALDMAARDKFEDLTGGNDPIVSQINEMIADSDLIEYNVMGILNSNLMLYRGMVDGGALDMGEEDILSEVWTQEDSVREDSRSWIQAYYLTAYSPLSEADLAEYSRFWRTDAGREFNRALFAVFDQMYEDLSYLLGRAAAQHMQGEEL